MENGSTFDNFHVYVDIPKQMMSELFTALFNGMQMNVSQVQSDNQTRTLLLNGSHLDLVEMMNETSGEGDMQGMEGMEGMDVEQTTMEAGTQQNATIITAATIVPEFPKSSISRCCWILYDCVHLSQKT